MVQAVGVAATVFQFASLSTSCLTLLKELKGSIAKWHRALASQLEPEYLRFREWSDLLAILDIDSAPGSMSAAAEFESRLRRTLRFDSDRVASMILADLKTLESALLSARDAAQSQTQTSHHQPVGGEPTTPTTAPPTPTTSTTGMIPPPPPPKRTKSSLSCLLFHHPKPKSPEPGAAALAPAPVPAGQNGSLASSSSSSASSKAQKRVTVGPNWTTVTKSSFLVLLDTISSANSDLASLLSDADRQKISRRVQAALLRGGQVQVKAVGDALPQEREIQTLAAVRDELRRERKEEKQVVPAAKEAMMIMTMGLEMGDEIITGGKYVASAIPPVKIFDVAADFDEPFDAERAREVVGMAGRRVLVEWAGYRDQEEQDGFVSRGNLLGLLGAAGLWRRFATLVLKGVVVDETAKRVGLVFDVPEGFGRETNLSELLRGPPLPLGQRFEMAKELAGAVHQLQAVDGCIRA